MLDQLGLYNYFVMFIGLIFNILLIIFVVVAILLVFSLLMISVEKKSFEFGVMRLVGLTKAGFVAMVLTQAGMFVLPAVVSAFMFSFPIIYVIYASMFGESLGYSPSVVPSGTAVLCALFVGVLIPLVSSIAPIRRGLSANLIETLDTTRSKSKGVEVSIVNKNALNAVPYLLYGSTAVTFGIIIYYGLPVALL